MRLKVNMALVVSLEAEHKPIKAGMTVLDLGAALGYYTVTMAQLVGAAAVRLRG
jgi:protein-L-isoaspartate O-methyltransferase